ncbi:AAA family ATPase [Pseudazoarcus pumilus]|nr:AAA family ATPase [Pseudazoarcus pumilus]
MTDEERGAMRKRKSVAEICSVDYLELAAKDLPEPESILGSWLLRQTLSMVYGWRGVGKSFWVMGVIWAVSTGGRFLKWDASYPMRVLYIDGELPARTLQDRFASLCEMYGAKPEPGFLTVITSDLLARAAPDLASEDDRLSLDELIEEKKIDVIVLDNLSCLIRSGAAENDAESWVDVSSWALHHRAKGRSVLFVHHAGKGGAQRGTSRREDLLDVVICLKKPPDYSPDEGARFEVHFEKARHLYGEDVEPFEAALVTDPDGYQRWVTSGLEGNLDDRIIEMFGLPGVSMTDIAREIGIDKSNVSRRIQRLKAEGRIVDQPKQPRTSSRDPRDRELL